MKADLVVSLAKSSSVIVNVEQAEQVRAMAERVGVCACGGALVANYQVLYTEQPAPAWVAMLETLERAKCVEVAEEECAGFVSVCEALGVCVHGGAIVERGDEILRVLYIE